MSLRRGVFQIFDFKKCSDLEIRVRGHTRSLKVVPFDRLSIYGFLLVLLFYRNFVLEIFNFKNAVTLNTGLGVRKGHWKCHHSIKRI